MKLQNRFILVHLQNIVLPLMGQKNPFGEIEPEELIKGRKKTKKLSGSIV